MMRGRLVQRNPMDIYPFPGHLPFISQQAAVTFGVGEKTTSTAENFVEERNDIEVYKLRGRFLVKARFSPFQIRKAPEIPESNEHNSVNRPISIQQS